MLTDDFAVLLVLNTENWELRLEKTKNSLMALPSLRINFKLRITIRNNKELTDDFAVLPVADPDSTTRHALLGGGLEGLLEDGPHCACSDVAVLHVAATTKLHLM